MGVEVGVWVGVWVGLGVGVFVIVWVGVTVKVEVFVGKGAGTVGLLLLVLQDCKPIKRAVALKNRVMWSLFFKQMGLSQDQ